MTESAQPPVFVITEASAGVGSGQASMHRSTVAVVAGAGLAAARALAAWRRAAA